MIMDYLSLIDDHLLLLTSKYAGFPHVLLEFANCKEEILFQFIKTYLSALFEITLCVVYKIRNHKRNDKIYRMAAYRYMNGNLAMAVHKFKFGFSLYLEEQHYNANCGSRFRYPLNNVFTTLHKEKRVILACKCCYKKLKSEYKQ